MKKAKIYKPAKTAMQSGKRNVKNWLLEFLLPDCIADLVGLYILAFFINNKLVGAAGFEPATLWSQTRCATRLRYAPIAVLIQQIK